MALFPLGILSAAGAGEIAGPAYELIQTQIVSGTSTGSVVFSSLGTYSSTYKHLQLRAAAKVENNAHLFRDLYLQLNGNTGTNYANHLLIGNGTSVSSEAGSSLTGINIADITATGGGGTTTTNVYGGAVIDFVDCYNASKFHTIRGFSGTVVIGGQPPRVRLTSGLWGGAAAITSFSLTTAGNFFPGSRFSLYGIKG
jgi:hypothetical protein